MDWLISSAWAQAAGGAQAQPGSSISMVFILIFIGVFYFFLIRPQNKRAKEHQAMIAALETGAEVVTSGGILGKVTELGEQFATVEIADGVQIKVQRNTINQVLPKGTLKNV
jgi:preprotein translocase subunit YajC